MFRKILSLMLGGIILTTEILMAASQIEKLISMNPEVRWFFGENQELQDRVDDFLKTIPSNLNEDLVLKKVGDLLLKYGMIKDNQLLLDKLQKEIILHQSRFEIRSKSRDFGKQTPSSPVSQEISVVLEDFQVNENAGSCNQLSPSIASASDGSYVVAWEDERDVDRDIYARCYNSSGLPRGSNFSI